MFTQIQYVAVLHTKGLAIRVQNGHLTEKSSTALHLELQNFTKKHSVWMTTYLKDQYVWNVFKVFIKEAW